MDNDREILREMVMRIGFEKSREILSEVSRSKGKTLTIISNGGLHRPPAEFIYGDIYYASEGDLNLSNTSEVNKSLDIILSSLKEKLSSERWNKIYLVPFGPAVISMAIKLAVFRILWMDTIDVFYFGNGEYGAIERDSRAFAFTS